MSKPFREYEQADHQAPDLNQEQVWLASKIKEWPKGATAITRGPFNSLIYVYPRNCTKDYCLNEDQFRELKKSPVSAGALHSWLPKRRDQT